MHWKRMCGPIVLISLLSPCHFHPSDAWRDPSPHTVQFVHVDKDVRLEVLNWGGSGRPVILLAGGGDTAHVFDEFAPKLTPDYRVYGITRRGFGASSYAPLKDPAKGLAQDIVAVIQALKLHKPVLVGHSIAGAELSSVATLHPNSIRGVVYLEAAYPYAFDNGKGPMMKDFLQIQGSGPQPPTPSEKDLASFTALQKWDAQMYGFKMPESEFRQTWDSTSEGRVTKQRDFPGSPMFMTIMTSSPKYANVPVPALAIFAIPHVPDAWMTESADPAIRNAANAYFAKLDLLAEKQAKVFEDGVSSARVVRVRGMHYIFLSDESEVLHEMRLFLDNLR